MPPPLWNKAMNALISIRIRWLWQAFVLSLAMMTAAHAAAPAPHRATVRYEVDFMSDMIDHHAMALMMATTCEQKAVHAELRELCTDIRMAQAQEIQTMQSWLSSWYGTSHSPEIKPGDRRRMERMAALPPAAYEVEFMESMIRHHAIAIRRASVCLDRADHRELRNLCQNIIQTQLDEIRMMQTWLCEWYRHCRRSRAA